MGFEYRVAVESRVDGAQDTGPFLARGVQGLRLVWIEPRVLRIEYEQAVVEHFRSYAVVSPSKDLQHVVELRLAPQEQYSLPSEFRERMRPERL